MGRAQDVMLTPEPEPALAPILRPANPPPVSQFAPSLNTPYRIGPVELIPSASIQHKWVEGLPVAGGERITTRTRTISAAVAADIGPSWSLRYSPRWVSYSSGRLSDSVDHYLSISGAGAFDRWGVQFSQNYTKSSATLIETAQQTDEETFATSLGLGRSLSPNLQFQLGASLNQRYTDIAPDLRSWSLAPSLTRRFTDRLSMGVSVPFSFSEMAGGSDYYSSTATANLDWHATDRISLAAHAGANFTRAAEGAARTLSNPVMGLTADYQLFEPTSLSLGVTRKVSASYLRDRITESLSMDVNVQQRLLGRLYLSVGYSRLENDYEALQVGSTLTRSDTVRVFRANLSTKLSSRFSLSGGFTRSKNSSNQSLFGYSGRQYNCQLSYSY